jgi:hypothetical protein
VAEVVLGLLQEQYIQLMLATPLAKGELGLDEALAPLSLAINRDVVFGND